ncbi:MAG: peptidase M24 [Anaerolineae bacterium SM23_ 63]|nr:MAG: peptidase M24 [Anaerolineae bacterium SM23_ 63]
MHQERLTRLIQTMKTEKLDAIALNPGPSLYYITGLSFHLMERPVVLILSLNDKPTLILPDLERSKAERSDLDLELISYGEDDASRSQAFQEASTRHDLDKRRIGVEPLRSRVFELRLLESVAPQASFTSCEATLSSLRIIKDENERDSIRRAVLVAEEALRATIPLIRLGMSERELASELTIQLLRAGSEPAMPFKPIVASGPNSALPHATPTDRRLQNGDLLIIDWGATVDGYISDITRTFALGEINTELEKIHTVVQRSNAAGREAIRPGASCQEIDRASRSVIDDSGYGQFFIHRTGHGIGLEAHEHPNIREGNLQILTPGMTFTVEPGIYLPDRGGVRVEDNVIVTESGGESLSTYSRQLEVIA